MEIKEIDGVKHVKTLIPCPDGIEGCLVAHYRWIPIEENKANRAHSTQKEEIEDIILDKSAEIYNMFATLEQTHPSDLDDMANAVHDIQKIISVRIARRVRSDKFITIKRDY